ncbi:MAG: FAD-dependent oxidoreductase [Flavobacteriales bacterium]|nr:FAD-dependent oxidoreductase [Flavobacteriales bacterium]|tara:strand:+ start:58748 stop:60052 length:1305 start_codon:yes stop_codon:yes gene_type:complete
MTPMQTCRIGDEICLPDSSLPRVVVIGGGFAGISLVKKLKNKPVQIVVLDKNNFHQFQPLLYQVATSGIEPDSIVFPLRKLFNGYKNVFFRMAMVNEIQSESNTIITDIGTVEYDHLVIATGSTTNFFGLQDVQQHSVGMKTIQEALDIRSLILQNLEKAVVTCDDAERNALTNFAIVGGGPAGVETAGAMAEFKKYILPKDYPELDASMMSIYLIEAEDELLNAMSDKSSENALKFLNKLGVDIRLNTSVQSYDGLNIKTDKAVLLQAKTMIWTAGVKGNVPTGINKENIARGNRILVDDYCSIKGYKNIYAVGDIAAIVSDHYPSGHPMVAQVAIQQGKQLANNILLQLQGKEWKKFSYKDKGSLATIGKRKAVADIGKLRFGGYIAWLLWSVVHLLSISGFRNKLLVGLNWAWSYFTYDKGNRLIIRKFRI